MSQVVKPFENSNSNTPSRIAVTLIYFWNCIPGLRLIVLSVLTVSAGKAYSRGSSSKEKEAKKRERLQSIRACNFFLLEPVNFDSAGGARGRNIIPLDENQTGPADSGGRPPADQIRCPRLQPKRLRQSAFGSSQ